MVASTRLLALVSFFTLFITVNSTASKMDYLVYAHVRTDPVTDPKNCDGKPGVSSHVHTYYGAAASLRPDTSYEEMRAACGNSGNVDDNKSLYWHPTIYRFDRDTGLYHIEKIYFASAYYVWRTPGPGQPRTMAFPPGFQMIARQGNPKARVLFDCSGESACERDGKDNCKPIHTCKEKGQCFPTNRCSELEIRIVFPACWDGKSLTSKTFMDHVAYGKGEWDTDQGDAYASECPDTHPVRIPEVHFYFRILDYEGGAYTFSDGSSIVHADYFSGWDEKGLQKVLDECKNAGQAAMPDQWCENHLSFRDMPKILPQDVKDPDGSDARIVKMLKKIQPTPALDPRKTVAAEAITAVKELPQGPCTSPLIPADPNLDWRCTRNCTKIGPNPGNRGGTCSDLKGKADGGGGGGSGDGDKTKPVGGGGSGDGEKTKPTDGKPSSISKVLAEKRKGKTAGNPGARTESAPAWYTLGNAPVSLNRKGVSLDFGGVERDAHAVYGFQCQSSKLKGKVFLIGKCASPNTRKNEEGNLEAKLDACAVLLNQDGTSAWGTNKYYIRTPKAPGDYAFLNGGVEAPDGSYLLVFGHTNNVRTIIKINPEDGSTLFEYRWDDEKLPDGSKRNSAFEFGFWGKDGDLYLSGFVDGEGGAHQSKWNFKSSGVVHGGKGLWQRIPKETFINDKMPASAMCGGQGESCPSIPNDVVIHAPTESATHPGGVYSFVSMKETADGFVAVGASAKTEVVMLLKKDGTLNKYVTCSNCGQLTGVAVSADKKGIAVSGHCKYDTSRNDTLTCGGNGKGDKWSGLDGTATYFTADLKRQWTRRYPTPPGSISALKGKDQTVVYEECWSIESTLDGGFVLGCGSGTHCKGVTVAKGANAHYEKQCPKANMEVWQGLVTKFWPNGEIAWQRIDTEQDNGEISPTGAANAIEYVTQNKDGTFLVTHDDTLGMGFRVLAKDPRPPCGSFPAWQACTAANKKPCSSGSTTCGACKTGFTAVGTSCIDKNKPVSKPSPSPVDTKPTPKPTTGTKKAEFVCKSDAKAPTKVFILAGQSNMAGYAVVKPTSAMSKANNGKGTLDYLVRNGGSVYKNIMAPRDDVIAYGHGEYEFSARSLEPGLGKDEDSFGPELGFGTVLGNQYAQKVVIIKVAWGGQSLMVDYRPPSSGGTVGKKYTAMIAYIKKILGTLKGDYKINGMGWHQGWNDYAGPDGAFQEYGKNLKNLVKDVRAALDAPDMRFVVANTGQGGFQGKHAPSEDRLTLLKQQKSITDPNSPNFVAYSAHVDTRSFWRDASISPKDEAYHWNWNAESAFLIGSAMGKAMIEEICPPNIVKPQPQPKPDTKAEVCNADVKSKCKSENKLPCSSGSVKCGAPCPSGTKVDGNKCTALAPCHTYTSSVTCDRRRCDFWPGPPAECYKKEAATDEKDDGSEQGKGEPVHGCYSLKKKTDCEGKLAAGRCEWGVEDGVGECWDKEATASGEVEGVQSSRRHLEGLPAGFTKISDTEIGGPMSQALIEAFYMCDFAPEYDWVEISDWWITSVSDTTPLKIRYSLIFPLSATAVSDYGELAGAVGDMLHQCYESGALAENLQAAAKRYKVTPLEIKSLEYDSKVKINRANTGRAGSDSATEVAVKKVKPGSGGSGGSGDKSGSDDKSDNGGKDGSGDKTGSDGSDGKSGSGGKSGGGGLRIRSPNAAIQMGEDVKLYRSGAKSLSVEADVTVAGELHAESISISGVDLKQLIQSVLKEAVQKKGE